MSRGQSLIELLIALGVFVVMVSVVAFLLINGYFSNLQARENSIAIFLAEEGLEATRSIRDNNWEDLAAGSHGLAISNNHWVFQGEEENIFDKLKEGKRKILIENLGQDRKKITSQVIWETSPERENKIELITYLTNWQKQAD